MMVLADKNDKRTMVNMFKYLKENVNIKKRKREDIFKNTKCTFLGLKNTISEIRIYWVVLIVDQILQKKKSMKFKIQQSKVSKLKCRQEKKISRNKQVEISTTTKTEPQWPTGKN